MTRNLHKDSPIPPYMAYPRFLLMMDISETAKLVYVLLLDRTRLSMKNEVWEDENGHVFIHYTTWLVIWMFLRSPNRWLSGQSSGSTESLFTQPVMSGTAEAHWMHSCL